MLLHNQQIKEPTSGIRKYLKMNENENTMYKNMGYSKTVLRGEFKAINTYIGKQERSQINNLTLQLKELEKEDQTKPETSRRKEIIKIKAE